MDHFEHNSAICESDSIGPRTRIWAFTHILPGASVGSDCNLCDHVFVENEVVIGDRVTVKCGVQLWDGITVEDDVFIGPNATFTNDLFPRSKQVQKKVIPTLLRSQSSIGANATILAGVEIGSNAMVGAGAVVTRNVPANAIVVGNPARIVGYVDAATQHSDLTDAVVVPGNPGKILDTAVNGVKLHHLPSFADLRGSLIAGEVGEHVSFEIRRFFIVHDVPSKETRGEHAHLQCEQLLVCLSGSVSIIADDGKNRQEFLLDRPNTGIYLPAMTWGVQYKYSRDTVLLVLASHAYDSEDYIRSYDEFLALACQSDDAPNT